MKRYRAVNEGNQPVEFEITDEGQVVLVTDFGLRIDVTEFTMNSTDFTDPEKALIDLYTDNGSGENVSIEEIK